VVAGRQKKMKNKVPIQSLMRVRMMIILHDNQTGRATHKMQD